MRRRTFTAAALSMGIAARAASQSTSVAINAQVAPGSVLRAGINVNNPLLARRQSAGGELSGVAVDLSQELARRLRVPLILKAYGAAGEMVDAAGSGAWDVAYLALDPERAAQIDFAGAYMELEGTYLVPVGSPFENIADVDRTGVRIAVTAQSAYDLFLSRTLKHAQLIRAATTPQSIELAQLEKLDAVAAVRTALVAAARQIAGTKVLAGHFMTIPQAVAVPKGRPLAIAYVREFLEQMKMSGFVETTLKKHGFGPDDAIVAP